MDRNIFSKLADKTTEAESCWAAFDAAYKKSQETTQAVQARIAAAKRYSASRISELKAICNSSKTTETMRKFSQNEIDALTNAKYSPSSDESEEFDTAIDEATSALDDYKSTQIELRRLFNAARDELDKSRLAYIGANSNNEELARRWLDGAQQDFSRIC